MIWADRVGLGFWMIALIAVVLLFSFGVLHPRQSIGPAGQAITIVGQDPWVGFQDAPKRTYRIEAPDKTVYMVDAPDEGAAIAALRTLYLQEHPDIPHEAWELDPVVGVTVKKSTNVFDRFDPATDVGKAGMFDDLIPTRQLGPWVDYQQSNSTAPRVMTQSLASAMWSAVWKVSLLGVLPFWLVLRIVDFIFNGPNRRRKRHASPA